VTDHPKRGWLQRLGLKADDPDPEDWVIVARGWVDSSFAERTVKLLAKAGVEATAKPFVDPDDSALRGIVGGVGPNADARARVAVVVHRRDQGQAEEIMRSRPRAQPISDEELTRLAEEAGPPPPE
jgi:hypothetical protein